MQGRRIISLLHLHQIDTNKIIQQNGIQRRHEFQNTYVYKSDKIVVSARIISLGV